MKVVVSDLAAREDAVRDEEALELRSTDSRGRLSPHRRGSIYELI